MRNFFIILISPVNIDFSILSSCGHWNFSLGLSQPLGAHGGPFSWFFLIRRRQPGLICEVLQDDPHDMEIRGFGKILIWDDPIKETTRMPARDWVSFGVGFYRLLHSQKKIMICMIHSSPSTLRMLLTVSLRYVYFFILVCYNDKFGINIPYQVSWQSD